MFKLIKFMKPFILPLLVAIALLYVQAMSDLALPDYMSNIVNTGIQQGGIEHAVPEAIRLSEMDKVTLFMNSKDKSLVLGHYELIVPTASNYKEYQKEYPNLVGDGVYVLKDLTNSQLDEINLIMAKAILSVSGVKKMIADAGDGDISFNDQTIPAGTDLFALLSQIPEVGRQEMAKASSQQFELMGDKMVISAGANTVKVLYDDLGIKTDNLQNNFILRVGLLMILVTLLGSVCSIAVGFIAAKIAAGLGRNLRKKVFTKIGEFSNTEFDKFSTASLITRSTNDITQIQTLMVMMIRMVFYAPIIGIGGVILALRKSPHMSWIIALAVILLLILIVSVLVIALPKFKALQKLVDKVNMVTRENLSGMMVIRAFNTQKFEENRFDQANKELTSTNLFVSRIMVFLFPVMMLIMNGVSLTIIWVGAHQIADSAMQVGDMMAFMIYAMQILMAFLMMSMMFIMIPRASVSASRIAEVLETKSTILDPISPKQFDQKSTGTLEFKNVSFKFPGAQEAMLKNISFKAQSGQTTAIIGSTGSGKTTLINLIPRFYDVTEGEVVIDGLDVRELTQHELRKVIGYIPQQASLFSGTIETNLRIADETASDTVLKEAAEIAQAMEFIGEKAEGFKADISQGGSNVSGGQKQRLAIARALVKKPKIFIFDDSFSALDFKTDLALRKALKDKTGDSTVLIVAQRISTIKGADQIIVLEDGKIVGHGTHLELMKTCETYHEIALSQLSKEELA